MCVEAIIALTCPACGGPLRDHSTRRCGFCGVALVMPSDSQLPRTGAEPVATHREIRRLRERLRVDPSTADTHLQLARAYRALGLTDDAIRSLSVAVGLAPEAVPARLELATLLASQSAMGAADAFPAAIHHIRQVLTLEPGSVAGGLLLARLLTQRGQFDQARAVLADLTLLPEADVRCRVAWVALAEAASFERRGKCRAAVSVWRRVAADSPRLVEPAVSAFLDRAVPASPGNNRHRRDVIARSTHWRVTLVAVVALVAGLAVDLPWIVLTGVIALPVLAMIPGLLASRRRPSPGSSGSELARLLEQADLVAGRADLLARRQRLDWSDNLAVGLTPKR